MLIARSEAYFYSQYGRWQGIVGFPNASMAVLPFGTGNDYIEYYVTETHIDNPKFKDIVVYRQAKNVRIKGHEGFCVSIDGEIYKSCHIEVENLEKKIRFVVPKL